MPDEKVPRRWLANCLVDLGELSFLENWALLSLMDVKLTSSALAKAIIKNINSTETMLSPCLTPTFKSIYVSTLLMMILDMLLLYMRLIAEHILGGAPYLPSMATSSA